MKETLVVLFALLLAGSIIFAIVGMERLKTSLHFPGRDRYPTRGPGAAQLTHHTVHRSPGGSGRETVPAEQP